MNIPNFKAILTTDSGIATLVFFPIIFVSIAVVGITISKNFALTSQDIYMFVALAIGSPFVFSPFIIWWACVIRKTFRTGKKLNGVIASVANNVPFHVGLNIKCKSENIDTTINYINNERVRKAIDKKNITLFTNKNNTIIFVKEAFLE